MLGTRTEAQCATIPREMRRSQDSQDDFTILSSALSMARLKLPLLPHLERSTQHAAYHTNIIPISWLKMIRALSLFYCDAHRHSLDFP